MTEARKKPPHGESVTETAATPRQPAPDGAPSPRDMADFQSEQPEALDPVTRLEAEKTELKDKLLRTLADMENLRRRTERELADGRTYAVTGFARDMLTVADNLARALAAVPAGAEGALKALVDGVTLTERDFLKTLERHGVKKLAPEGQKFDPNFHQAMFEAPHPQHAKGLVSTVVQTGYAIGDRVLRPALVGVSAGQTKPN